MMRSPPLRQAVELLSSMRFAISLLSFLAVASVIGTILKQGEPYNNYLNQFGQFWFAVFETLSLYGVYNAWWFVLILAFLVTSTSLCVIRNTPKMIAQMRGFKEHLREQSFAAFAHRAEFDLGAAVAGAGSAAAPHVNRIESALKLHGFNTKVAAGQTGTMVAAKAGSANRLGYVFAHVGIIVICVGGLLDGDLLLRAQLAFGGKDTVKGVASSADIPASARLGAGNPSFRGNVLIPEGGARDFALLNHGDGVLLQELPFKLDLKRFVIEHYATGQPKLFASDVVVTDKESGKTFEARIEVNKPLIYRGIAVYQSSFDDGGTRVKLKGHPLSGARGYTFDLEGEVGNSTTLAPASADTKMDATEKALTVEFTGFRPFNIERIGGGMQDDVKEGGKEAGAEGGKDGGNSSGNDSGNSSGNSGSSNSGNGKPRGENSFAEKLKQGLGPGAAPGREKEMRNVGPSFSYKLRDAAGQAREYNNYMLPVLLDRRYILLSGMREKPDEAFRYLRLPIDKEGSLTDFMRLRAALNDTDLRIKAGALLAERMMAQGMNESLRKNLAESGRRALETFGTQGFQAVAAFIEKGVPEAEREKAADVFVRLLNGAAFEAWQLARLRDGLPRRDMDATSGRFVQDALNAISDSFFYGAPVYLQLNGYDEVKASVFQLTRSPGKNIVYLGSLLLVLGVFAMLYIRERRAWALVKPDGRVLFAMSALRRGIDDDREFERLSGALGALQPAASLTANQASPQALPLPSGT